jgi:hypothetical protein
MSGFLFFFGKNLFYGYHPQNAFLHFQCSNAFTVCARDSVSNISEYESIRLPKIFDVK